MSVLRGLRPLVAALLLMVPLALAHRALAPHRGTYKEGPAERRGFETPSYDHLYSETWRQRNAERQLAKKKQELNELTSQLARQKELEEQSRLLGSGAR